MRTMTVWIALIVAVWMVAGCSQPGSQQAQAGAITEEEMGLRHASLYEEQVQLNQPLAYSSAAPGTAGVLPRSFENAPPMIPHSVEGLIPITASNNTCVGCHMPEVAEMMGAVAIPASHLHDLRNDRDLKGKLSGSRYSCTQCHAPQVDREPAVKSRFEAAWRTREGMGESNLMEVIGEGIE